MYMGNVDLFGKTLQFYIEKRLAEHMEFLYNARQGFYLNSNSKKRENWIN